VERSLEAGASGYVLKDVPVAELSRAIQAVARGGRYLSAGAQGPDLDTRAQTARRAGTRFDLLTSREREVLKLLAEGLSVKEAAAALDRSAKTVEVHKTNLMRKLGVHDRAGLVKCAIAHRLVPLPLFDDAAGSPPARKP
jgi:DNA-binding NarL/FixJ family response regulator